MAKILSVTKGISAVTCALVIFTNLARAEEPLWVEGGNHQSGVEIQLPSFAPIVEKLGKAVVNISITGSEKVGMQTKKGGAQGNFPFDFPLPENGAKRSFSSLGSGFVIHPDGYIVTNHHLVDKASKISINFRDDKKNYEAKVVGADPKTDIALLKVDFPGKLQAVVLADSDKIETGDWVLAIGNPFLLGHTATVGIVSAKSRKLGDRTYDNFIQTDASINPGNSGGPLFNARGEVIGMNTFIMSPGVMGSSGFNIGIGFATPINLVKTIVAQLHKRGKVVRGWLGVMIQPVSEDIAEAIKLSSISGALVADVLPNSPASRASFQRGDVILKFDGKVVEQNDDLPLMVAETEIGRTVEVEIIREGKAQTIKVKIEELKDSEVDKTESSESEESSLGLTVQELTPDIARSLGLEDVKGVVVAEVKPETVAEKAGLRRGDVILEVAGKAVSSTSQFRENTKDLQKNKPLLLLIRRGDNTVFLTLKVE